MADKVVMDSDSINRTISRIVNQISKGTTGPPTS